MIYGVPCCDGEEDNPIITEEKVVFIIKKNIYVRNSTISDLVNMEYG